MIRASLLTHNLGWKLFSLLVAVMIWYVSARDPELVSIVSVPVQYHRLPVDLEISSEVIENVDLELRGASGLLSRLSDSKPSVVLDFSRVAGPGERTFGIEGQAVSLPYGVKLVRAIPSQLRFDFEKRVTAQVPVEVRFSGKLQKNYHILRHEVTPPVVVLEGPEDRVRRLTRVETDSISLDPIVATAEFRVNTFAADPHLRFRGSPRVVVRVFVEKR